MAMKRHAVSRNPFFGRTLYISDYIYDDDYEFYEELERFLGRFGRHFHHLTLSCFNDIPEVKRNRTSLITRTFFELVPNLRRLRIEGDFQDDVIESRMPLLAEGLPFMPNLETLQLEQTKLPLNKVLVLKLLGNHRQQLKRLHVSHSHWKLVSGEEWPSLHELHLSGVRLEKDLSALTSRCNTPNLEKLGVNLTKSSNERREIRAYGRLLTVINYLCKKAKLHTLRISGGLNLRSILIGSMEMEDEGLRAPPELKTLEMELFPEWYTGEYDSFSVLLRFPFVERIHTYMKLHPTDLQKAKGDRQVWECRSEIAFVKKEDLQRMNEESSDDMEVFSVRKHLFKGNMYSSDIWGKLPRLRVFTFNEDVYTKEGWEGKMKREGRVNQEAFSFLSKKSFQKI